MVMHLQLKILFHYPSCNVNRSSCHVSLIYNRFLKLLITLFLLDVGVKLVYSDYVYTHFFFSVIICKKIKKVHARIRRSPKEEYNLQITHGVLLN